MQTFTLTPGHELRCPHCHCWHPLILNTSTVSSTTYADAMLFWRCANRSGLYYAGQVGGSSRFETRRAVPKS